MYVETMNDNNETTLHKLAGAISDVDGGVNSVVDFVDENSFWLIWVGIGTLVLIILGCYVCPALQLCICLWKTGCCCCRGCCRALRYSKIDEDG